jgi:hypothetical protein
MEYRIDYKGKKFPATNIMDFLQFRLGLGEYFVSGGTKRTADEIENSDDENANVIGNERKKRRVPATLPLALAR